MPKKTITHAAKDLPLVVVELGSQSVRAMAAERIGQDMLHVLAYEENSMHPCVEQGLVCNPNDAGYMISEVLHLLANRLHVETIPAAFTLIGGKYMQSVNVKAHRDLIHKSSITEAVKEDIRNECKTKIENNNPDVAVYGLIPSYYELDHEEIESEPLDKDKAIQVVGHYAAFVGHKDGRDKLNKSFDNAKTSIVQTFVRPDAVLSAISAENSDLLTNGCAVIDFGAQTTTVSVYKGSEYLLNRVIPVGGWHISRFIEQQGIPFEYAEYIKCLYGMASPCMVEKDQVMTIPSSIPDRGDVRVKFSELATIIEMKLNEIVQRLQEILRNDISRITTIYVTGGGSMLQGLLPYLEQRLGLPVYYGSHAYLLDRQTDDEYCKPKYTSLIGGLILGSDWRDKHKDAEISDKKSFKSRLLSAFTETTLPLFTDSDY